MSVQEVMAKERQATEEAFVRGNVKALDEVFAPNCVFHTPPLISSYSREDFKKFAGYFNKALSDIRWLWHDSVIQGNTAAQRYSCRGNHVDVFPEMPPAKPTGKEVLLVGCAFYHLENDKIIEFFEYSDWLGFFQQLGIIPPPEQK
jgi:predicted ester cyclase